jgi:ribosomal protein L11 methylase PrmA
LRARLSVAGFVHIHMHARFQSRNGDNGSQAKKQKVSAMALRGMLDNLKTAVRKLDWTPAGTVWGDYYSATNYSDEGMRHKTELVGEFLDAIRPAGVWDLGANNGQFSRLASGRGIPTLSLDFDPAAVEQNYRFVKKGQETLLLPLVMDLTNPSGGIGWDGRERQSLFERGPADTVMALALIHHLAISNNVPLERLAEFFARLGRNLIIGFVPKEDSQVQRLLASREDVFADYTREGFERAFGRRFTIVQVRPIASTRRLLYHMTGL